MPSINRDVANRYAAYAQRNLLSLRRTLAANPRFARPPWSEGEQGRRLAPLVLASSWSDDVDGDRTAIETLTGRTYTDIEGDLASWAAQDDAPVTRTGQVWRVVSKEDAWDLVSPLITKTTLNQFHDVAARVLEEPDPALDVPADRRFMAAVVGRPRTYSPRLRAPKNASWPRSTAGRPTASPTGGPAPEPSSAGWPTTTTNGHAGRTVSPRVSVTTAPEPHKPGGGPCGAEQRVRACAASLAALRSQGYGFLDS